MKESLSSCALWLVSKSVIGNARRFVPGLLIWFLAVGAALAQSATIGGGVCGQPLVTTTGSGTTAVWSGMRYDVAQCPGADFAAKVNTCFMQGAVLCDASAYTSSPTVSNPILFTTNGQYLILPPTTINFAMNVVPVTHMAGINSWGIIGQGSQVSKLAVDLTTAGQSAIAIYDSPNVTLQGFRIVNSGASLYMSAPTSAPTITAVTGPDLCPNASPTCAVNAEIVFVDPRGGHTLAGPALMSPINLASNQALQITPPTGSVNWVAYIQCSGDATDCPDAGANYHMYTSSSTACTLSTNMNGGLQACSGTGALTTRTVFPFNGGFPPTADTTGTWGISTMYTQYSKFSDISITAGSNEGFDVCFHIQSDSNGSNIYNEYERISMASCLVGPSSSSSYSDDMLLEPGIGETGGKIVAGGGPPWKGLVAGPEASFTSGPSNGIHFSNTVSTSALVTGLSFIGGDWSSHPGTLSNGALMDTNCCRDVFLDSVWKESNGNCGISVGSSIYGLENFNFVEDGNSYGTSLSYAMCDPHPPTWSSTLGSSRRFYHGYTGGFTSSRFALDNASNLQANTATAVWMMGILGPSPSASNISLLTNWGTTAAVSAVSGSSQRFRFTITPGGSSIMVDPTFSATFATAVPSPPLSTPQCVAVQVGGTGTPAFIFTGNETTTGTGTMTWNGTPVSGKTYVIQVDCL